MRASASTDLTLFNQAPWRLALALVFLSGCIAVDSVPLQVALSPQTPQAPIKLAKGTRLYLSIVDARPRKLIGYRGPNISGAEITVAGDLVSAFHEPLSKGLSSLGFDVVNDVASAGKTLSLELQSLGYWRGSNMVTTASIKATVTSAPEQTFAKTYTAAKEYSVTSPPEAGAISDRLNSAVQELVWKILADLELLQALQSAPTTASTPSNRRHLVRAIGQSPTASARVLPMAQVYKGMNLRFMVGFTTRTPADEHTRLIADGIQKYLPGSHSIQNMPGFSSITAANYLSTVAKPDGSTVGVFSGDAKLWKEMEAKGNVKSDWRKFLWLGGLHNSLTNERFFFAVAPASPDEIVELLRTAFSNLAADPQYRANIAPSGMTFMSVAEVEAVVEEFYKIR